MDDRKIAEQAVREAIRGYYGDGAFVARLLDATSYAFKCMEVMEMFYSVLVTAINERDARSGKTTDIEITHVGYSDEQCGREK